MSRTLQGIAWMTASSVLWTLIEALGRKVPSGYSPYQTVWVRYATHLAVMLAILGPWRGAELIRTQRPGLQILRSLLMLGMPVCFIVAVGRLSAAETWSIFWVSPFLVALLSRWWLGERSCPRHWAAAATALIGALLILGAGPGAFRVAAVLPLGMAACFSVYVVMTRAMREETTTATLFYTALFVLVPLTFGIPAFWHALRWEAALPMAAIGVVGFFGLLALDRALHLAPASVVAPFAVLQAVWTLLLDHLLFGHRVGAGQLCGALALVGGGLYVCAREWAGGEGPRRA
jgi:drug/metabolite transporter (DMT)-like permease